MKREEKKERTMKMREREGEGLKRVDESNANSNGGRTFLNIRRRKMHSAQVHTRLPANVYVYNECVYASVYIYV